MICDVLMLTGYSPARSHPYLPDLCICLDQGNVPQDGGSLTILRSAHTCTRSYVLIVAAGRHLRREAMRPRGDAVALTGLTAINSGSTVLRLVWTPAWYCQPCGSL